MARATTKADLLTAAQTQFEKLLSLIDSMDEDFQNAPFSKEIASKGKENHWKRDKNLRDVLIHLYEWHQLLLNWVDKNTKGESVPFLPSPYNWKTYGDMNVEFWKKHQNTPLTKAKDMVEESHKDVMKLIETFSNEELFAKNALPWTGTSPLGSYCVSATSSHYDWAIKKIKANIKLMGK